MTSLSASAPSPSPSRGPLAVALPALAALAVAGVVVPRAALHGWLIGFTFAAGAPLGALALLLVHALTGGRWGEAHRPALLRLARATPALVLLVLPLVFGARTAYPWAADPATAGEGVPTFYLNPLAVALRSVAGLGILSWVAMRLGRGRVGRLAGGLGLCVYAPFMNAAAYDWLLSLAPRFTSSAFGPQVIVGQILTALCCTVLVSDAGRDDASWGDLGALMLAATLGLGYLVLMGVTVNWYGDLPEQARWYMVRSRGGWAWLEAAGAILGAAAPPLALLFTRVRNNPGPLRAVALCTLAGLGIEHVWLVSPATEPLSAATGLVGTLAAGALLAAASGMLPSRGKGGRDGD